MTLELLRQATLVAASNNSVIFTFSNLSYLLIN